MRRGGEKRGSSYDRAARKNWLLSPGSGFGGDGEKVPCFYCSVPLSYEMITIDRIVPGSKGGRYIRNNIRPACQSCNVARSDNEDWTP